MMIKHIYYCEEYEGPIALYDDTWDPRDISLVVNNIHRDEAVALVASDLQDLLVFGQRIGSHDKTPNGMVRNIVAYMAWCIGKGYKDFAEESRCREWLAECRKGWLNFYAITGRDQPEEPLPPWYAVFIAGAKVPTYGPGTLFRKSKEGE